MNINSSFCMPDRFPVTAHTDFVSEGGTFVVVKGFKHDGLSYVPLALEKGAKKIVLESDIALPESLEQAIASHHATVMRVADSRIALAQLSAQAAGYPHKQLSIIGITGTKGKTTTSFLLHHILQHAGVNVALMSTVHNIIGTTRFKAPLTTAQPDYLHQFLKLCVEHGVTTVVMEVAAQAVSMHRVHGIVFDAVIFTNFSQEHAEFYASMDDYFAAKTALLHLRKPNAPAFINADDLWCQKLAYLPHVQWYSLSATTAEWHASVIQECPQLLLACQSKNNSSFILQAPNLLGRFNGYNLLAASAVAQVCGVSERALENAVADFTAVPGRMQRFVMNNGAVCIIDYAHNPSSFEQLFKTISAMTPHMIVVFGAGGERDTSKRPVMGALAAHYAQLVILTSDNPRSENPDHICDDILSGISDDRRDRVIRMLDRAEAIKIAYQLSTPSSYILLLGKGPDEYQIIGDQKLFFSEAAVVQSLV